MDPGQRRLAERRLLAALRRLHAREPLRADLRVDAVLDAARLVPAARSARHRGSAPLTLDDAGLLRVLDALQLDGRVIRRGRRVRLAEHRSGLERLEPVMRDRVDQLLAGLRAAGAAPPRVSGLAARLGIPDALLEQLRSSGELVAVAPDIDYPRDVWDALRQRIDRLAEGGPLTVGRTREALRTTRRHAEAILAQRRAERGRRRLRSPRPGG